VEPTPCTCQQIGPSTSGSLVIPSASGKTAVLCAFEATAARPAGTQNIGLVTVAPVAAASSQDLRYDLTAQIEGAAEIQVNYAPGAEASATGQPIQLSILGISVPTTLTAWGCTK